MNIPELITWARKCANGGGGCKECPYTHSPLCEDKMLLDIAGALEKSEEENTVLRKLAALDAEFCESCVHTNRPGKACDTTYDGDTYLCGEDDERCGDCPCRKCVKGCNWEYIHRK